MNDGGNALGGGIMAGMMGAYCCFLLVIYVYISLCISKIAKKCGLENTWMAWIPIVNIWLLIQCAGKEWWWILLMFIPLLNIVIAIIVWMAIAERLGKPSWVGILVIVPVVGFFIPGYLAFSK